MQSLVGVGVKCGGRLLSFAGLPDGEADIARLVIPAVGGTFIGGSA